MKTVGFYLLIFGFAVLILDLLELDFAITQAFNRWGENVGLGIKAGMIVLGFVLIMIPSRKKKLQNSYPEVEEMKKTNDLPK